MATANLDGAGDTTMHAQRSVAISVIRMPFPDRRHLLGGLLNQLLGAPASFGPAKLLPSSTWSSWHAANNNNNNGTVCRTTLCGLR
jgi:hypothetical protein